MFERTQKEDQVKMEALKCWRPSFDILVCASMWFLLAHYGINLQGGSKKIEEFLNAL